MAVVLKRAPNSRARLCSATALGLLLGLGGALPAYAQAPLSPPVDANAPNALARTLLPYTPVFFDFAVQIGRSFAEITYGARGYDPITQTFTVSDLRVHRDQFDFTVARLRAGLGATQFDDFSVDLSRFPLPPDVQSGLRALGQERLTGDAVFTVKADEPRAAYQVSLEMDFPRVGQLAMTGAVDGFHVLVPLDEPVYKEDGTEVSRPPQVAGTLQRFSLSYRDLGLLDAATDVAAKGQGVSPDQMRAGLAAMPLLGVGALLDGLPGGASPELRAQAQEWARAVGDFARDKGEIQVTFDPPEPVPLQRFADGVVDEALIQALNPSVTRPDPDARVALAAPADPLSAATAQLTGVGALQDQAAGVTTLLGLARDGDAGAVTALSKAFGSAAVPPLAPAESAGLYTFLLVGRAQGEPVSDTTLAALTAVLDPAVARNAERDAAAWFEAHAQAGDAPVALTPDTIATLRPADLRARAFDAYEGRSAPRDVTEAYALSLVAAAAGDPIAASLRDNLEQAAASKRLVLDDAEARTRAAALWQAYSTADAAAQPEPGTEEGAQPATDADPQAEPGAGATGMGSPKP